MADQEVLKLLQEIHDLQKLHVELYKSALSNQQQAIEMQIKAHRRQKITLVVALGIVLLGVAIVVASSLMTH